MATNTKTKVLINDKFMAILSTDRENLSQRSTLLQSLLQNHDPENNEPIKIKLERPEKCSIILFYLETEEVSEELCSNITFASYINDVIHLGIHDLQNYLSEKLEQILFDEEAFVIDFTKSRPNLDFMENFFQNNKEYSSFSYLDLILNWMGRKSEFTRNQVSRLLENVLFKDIMFVQIDLLKKRYPEAFAIVMRSPSLDGDYSFNVGSIGKTI